MIRTTAYCRGVFALYSPTHVCFFVVIPFSLLLFEYFQTSDMKVTLLWVLPFATDFARARPAPDEGGELLPLSQDVALANQAECIADSVSSKLSFWCFSADFFSYRVTY